MYRYEEDTSAIASGFDIIEDDGDNIIATVGSKEEAAGLTRHLNHPYGTYRMEENPEGKTYRFAVMTDDDDVLAFFRIRESAEGILTHLNRNN